jgi:dsRNA-specific ribonuclease
LTTDLPQKIGHLFAQPELLEEALTHPAAAAESPRTAATTASNFSAIEFWVS